MQSGRHQSVKMSRQELRKLADFREMAEAHIERLGQAIMRRRKALGWSRAKLGRETNAHEKTVERWEKAKTAGALDNLEAIAQAFDMDPDDLLAEAMVRQHRGPTPDVLGVLNGDTLSVLTEIRRDVKGIIRRLDAASAAERARAAGGSVPDKPRPQKRSDQEPGEGQQASGEKQRGG